MEGEFGSFYFSGNTQNHVLALLCKGGCAGRNIKLHPIALGGSGYHSVNKDVDFASASPPSTLEGYQFLLERFTFSVALWAQAKGDLGSLFFLAPRYHLVKSPHLTTIYQVKRNGCAHIKEAIKTAQSVEELVVLVPTKRYTEACLIRLLTYLGVQARKCDLSEGICPWLYRKRHRQHLIFLKGQVSS